MLIYLVLSLGYYFLNNCFPHNYQQSHLKTDVSLIITRLRYTIEKSKKILLKPVIVGIITLIDEMYRWLVVSG